MNTYNLSPYYQIHTTEANTLITVYLPGSRKDLISVDLSEGILTIQAKRELPTPEGSKILCQELENGTYWLQLRLNPRLDNNRISASFENGTLLLTIPLAESAKPKQIAVA